MSLSKEPNRLSCFGSFYNQKRQSRLGSLDKLATESHLRLLTLLQLVDFKILRHLDPVRCSKNRSVTSYEWVLFWLKILKSEYLGTGLTLAPLSITKRCRIFSRCRFAKKRGGSNGSEQKCLEKGHLVKLLEPVLKNCLINFFRSIIIGLHPLFFYTRYFRACGIRFRSQKINRSTQCWEI